MLSYEQVHTLFNYDPATGHFIRRITTAANAKAGDVAGTKLKSGYISIHINGKVYLAHRLVWLYIYGYFPENDIDHKNRIKDDNRLSNLREVSRQCNSRNCRLSKNNTSTVTGVTFCTTNKKWTPKIKINYKNHSLGSYDDFDEAVCARLAGEQCVGWAGCDSSSPAYKYVKKIIGRKVL